MKTVLMWVAGLWVLLLVVIWVTNLRHVEHVMTVQVTEERTLSIVSNNGKCLVVAHYNKHQDNEILFKSDELNDCFEWITIERRDDEQQN